MNRSQAFLLGLLGLLSVLTFAIVFPFFEYVVAAGLLGYVLHPFHRHLEPRVGARPSAAILILLTLSVFVAPLAYVGWIFVGDLREIARGESSLNLPLIEDRIQDVTGFSVDITELLRATAQQLFDALFGSVGGLVSVTIKAGMGVGLMVFLLYYVLIEGAGFVEWFRDLVPLPERVTDQLLRKLDETTWGVVVGHFLVAVGQAIIAGIGLWVAGVPDPAFWTFIMAVLALLPIIGAFMVWGPAAAYLVLVGDTTAGVLLAIYGLAVVSLVDNYARPILIDRRAHLNPGVILVGVVGGIYAIGFTGLFIGPIVIGVLVATLETFRSEYDAV